MPTLQPEHDLAGTVDPAGVEILDALAPGAAYACALNFRGEPECGEKRHAPHMVRNRPKATRRATARSYLLF
jgi:hypothetical protein